MRNLHRELNLFARAWWCRGGAVAVLFLMAAVATFRAPRHLMFWFAIGFVLIHLALTVWWYLRDRKNQATAVVIRTHHKDGLNGHGLNGHGLNGHGLNGHFHPIPLHLAAQPARSKPIKHPDL